MFVQSAWLKVILVPVLDLVCSSAALFMLVKANGYIAGFDMLTVFYCAIHSVPDIQELSGCVVCRMLFGAFSWSG